IFSVDLFNEGVDLPAIDTIMMLRPTASKILFLQQLGRGLRLHAEKDFVRVLDFIGNHKAFLNKPESLFGVSSLREFVQQQQAGMLPLPKGCYANYDVAVIDFLQQVARSFAKGIIETYELLKSVEQRRPSAVEALRAEINFGHIRSKFGSWFELLAECGDLDEAQKRVLQRHRSYFLEIETASLTKSYKMVLLEAMLELDGFIKAQTLHHLAIRSAEILQRRPLLMKQDLPKQFRDLKNVLGTQSAKWLTYWNKNPVNAFIGGNKKDGQAFFKLQDDRLVPNFKLAREDRDIFRRMVQELVDYKMAMYSARGQADVNIDVLTAPMISAEVEEDWAEIPFFPNLKIACGHFKNANAENEAIVHIPPQYRADPSRHFIACASGNSMDGGKQPIKDGDYILLESINSDRAGSISNQIMAVEQQDVSGDDQYVLRMIRKRDEGGYYFQANNPEYADFDSTSEMRTFARFCGIVVPADVVEKNR
ncbi:MAG: S24 family peptidase, partial [Thiohalomonadales bacterium]